jgi:hypothetical protein
MAWRREQHSTADAGNDVLRLEKSPAFVTGL